MIAEMAKRYVAPGELSRVQVTSDALAVWWGGATERGGCSTSTDLPQRDRVVGIIHPWCKISQKRVIHERESVSHGRICERYNRRRCVRLKMTRFLSFRWIVSVLVMLGVMAAVAVAGSLGQSNPRTAIIEAARAPYVAFAHRDAHALCSDFTAAVSIYLIRGTSRDEECVERVSKAFAAVGRRDEGLAQALLAAIRVVNVTWHGVHARVGFLIGGKGGGAGKLMLNLLRVAGTWRIATRPVLIVTSRCHTQTEGAHCRKNGVTVVFFVGVPILAGPPSIAPPSAVRRAGGHELREFEVGATVAVDSGCLACHRIGDQGNHGPGPALTYVGRRLSESQIQRALVSPSPPMPSFKNLPKTKFRALMRFLMLLR